MIASAQTGAKITVNAGVDGIVITAEGTATHAATPHLGVNAQTALLDMLAGMPFAESKGHHYICALNKLFPHGDYNGRALGVAMNDEKSGELTLNFGVLRFTETGFSGNFDSRTPACADETDLLGMIRKALEQEGINLTNSTMSKCHHTPKDSEFVQTLLRIYEEYTGNPSECLTMGGQTYVHEIEGGVAFGCKLPGTNNNVHGANEFIGVEQLIISAKMFAQSIIDMCGG
jgi:succinyl-diaminopimelate desuccinylase